MELKMIYKFPRIKISNEDKIWLEACCERIYEEVIDPKALKVQLRDKLPPRYNEYQIDNRLIAGCNITLLGIWHVDPGSKLIENTEKVICHIKELIIASPDIKDVSDYDINNGTGIDKNEIKIIFKLMNSIGKFWAGNSISGGIFEIKLDSEEVFDEYLAFESLEKQVVYHLRALEKQIAKDYIELGLGSPFGDILKRDNLSPVPNTAFVIMSIDKSNPQSEDAFSAIKEVCKNFSIKAVRADEIEHSDKITDIILESIKRSEFLIADVSGERPNVYYEIGYAHAIGKRPIIYRRAGTKIHFDLANYNIPEYGGVYELKDKLTKRLTEITGKTI